MQKISGKHRSLLGQQHRKKSRGERKKRWSCDRDRRNHTSKRYRLPSRGRQCNAFPAFSFSFGKIQVLQTIYFLSLPRCVPPTSSGLSLSHSPSLFRQSWPAISQGPQSQHLPPLPCCHEHCTPQTPPSWAAERSQSLCPSSPAEQGPQWLMHPDWWGLQSGSLVRCYCRKRKEKIRNCEIAK